MDTIFSGDTYKTDDTIKAPFYDYLLLRSRWGLYLCFAFDIVLRYKKEAEKGIYDYARWGHSSHHVLQMVEKFGGKFHISGMNHLTETEGPFVFIANHMSTLETLILPGIIVPHMPVTFVVKTSLTKGNFFGPIMRSRKPIAVERKNPREDLEKVLKQGQEKLGNGESIIIFPQSTRSAVFDPAKFNSLGIKLALRAGVKVIPIALKTDYWGDSKVIRGFGPVRRNKAIHFAIGKPIQPTGRGKEEHQQVVNFIQDHLDSWSD